MTSPITVLLKISIWHQMDISTNVDINTYTLSLVRTHTHTHSHALAHVHTNTWSQLTGAKDIAVGVKFLALYHIKNNT